MEARINLEIAGLGIIMYSPHAAAAILENSDFLTANYWKPEDVARHVMKGSIVGFCTGSPGTFHIHFSLGYPGEEVINTYQFCIRLGIEVCSGVIVFRDLYDLMTWTSLYPINQGISVENGFYRLTVCTNRPESGIFGQDQNIAIYAERYDAMPPLRWDGVPTLCY
jgi:hypothetical protein